MRLLALPPLLMIAVLPVFAGDPVAVDACPPGDGIGQPLSDTQSSPGFSGDGDGLRAYDDFGDAPGPITSIVWWGGGLGGGECQHGGGFEISFYEENGGQPGDEILTVEVSPTVTSTGFSGPQGAIYRHEATFDSPINLMNGWISVFAIDFDGCYFYWANGLDGNNLAYTSGGGAAAVDFAFCVVSGAGPFAATDCDSEAAVAQEMSTGLVFPGFSDTGDGLRAYDNFSGVTDPIVEITWWGGGATIGMNCDRNPEYEIAFYEDNGGQPGSLITSENVTASVSATGYATTVGFLYRHEATLSTPVEVGSGWVSVYGINFEGCYFYWMNGENGDGLAYSTGGGSVAADFAFCLYTEDGMHTADQDESNTINLSELLRVIQFFNSAGFGCEIGTEDGYAPNDPDTGCDPHDSDYNPQDWEVSLSELLRLIQFFNSGGYYYCPDADPATEDGYCPGSD